MKVHLSAVAPLVVALSLAFMPGAYAQDAGQTDGEEAGSGAHVPLTSRQIIEKIAINLEDHPLIKAGSLAKREYGISQEASLYLKGLRLFFDLHASELKMRGFYESHSSAYVRWGRSRGNVKLGLISPIDVAEKLALVEKTRLAYYEEVARNTLLKLQLEEMIGHSLPDELTAPPKPPSQKPPSLEIGAIMEAAGMNGPDEKIRRLFISTVMNIENAWRRVIAARADMDWRDREFLQSQQIYQQERSTSIGSSMVHLTHAEAYLTRATGDYVTEVLRLSVLVEGDDALRDMNDNLTLPGLEAEYLKHLMGGAGGGGYVPASGSGFGQEDK